MLLTIYSEDAVLHTNQLFAVFRAHLHIAAVILSSIHANVSFKVEMAIHDVILLSEAVS